MDIIVINGNAGTYSWTDGFRFASVKSLDEEARRNPEAVINRLLKEGETEEAERILDVYV
jgi:hypothetical protein